VRDRRVVESLATSITNRLLHEPTLALREDPDRAVAAVALFRLDPS
jgi:glutamyl-tRNA reductase